MKIIDANVFFPQMRAVWWCWSRNVGIRIDDLLLCTWTMGCKMKIPHGKQPKIQTNGKIMPA